jgi:LytS/YehU family sensor histidine kinase
VTQTVRIDPELYDSMIPSMLLQPIVENAYVHGLSKIESAGKLTLEAHRSGNHIHVSVINSGIGLSPASDRNANGHGVGLRNIMSRLKLHYGEDSRFEIAQMNLRDVRVEIEIPLQFAPSAMNPVARFGTR